MKLERVLQPETLIQLYLPNQPQKPYLSTVERVTDATFWIDDPFARSEDMVVGPGQTVTCTINHANALYRFETQVLDHKQNGSLCWLILKNPDNVDKIQRREFFRLEVSLPLHYRVLPKFLTNRPVPFRTVETKNISGGGVLFSDTITLKTDTLLDLLVELPWRERGTMQVYRANLVVCVGKVVTLKKSGENSLYGVEFVYIEDRSRAQIIDFIFEEQSQRMKMMAGHNL